jgi:hypothetical protein
MDRHNACLAGLYQSGMGLQQNGLNFADIARTGAGEIGDLLPHFNLSSFRQICPTLVFAAYNLICMSLRLKIGLLLQCYLNSREGVPCTSRLLKNQNHFKGFIVAQLILCALNCLAPFADRGVPFSDARDHNAARKNPSPQSFLMEIRLNFPMSPIGRQKCSSAVRRGFTPVLSQTHQVIQPHRRALGRRGQNPAELRAAAAPG